MRFAIALLATTACGRIFGLEEPTLRDQVDDGDVDDGGLDDVGLDDGSGADASLTIKSFRRGVDGYMSSTDTYLDAPNPSATRSGAIDIRVRDAEFYGLVMFDGVFSTTAIPVGAQIQLARLQVTNLDSTCAGRLVEVAVAWNDTTVFNTFGPATGVQITDLGAVVVAALPSVAGDVVLDVTSSLQAWSIDPAANHGWMFEPAAGTTSECKIRSGEVGQLSERPQLEVIYVD